MRKTFLAACTASLIVFSISAFASEAIPLPPKDPTLKQAIKWYRDSAEKKALYREVFAAGYQYIQNTVKESELKPKTWGIVLDIDETTLDNSAYFYKYENCLDDESTFETYVTIPGKSTALPGVKEMVKKVHSLGGYVSFVTNRDGSFKDSEGNSLDATVQTLKNNDIYFDQVILSNYKDSATPTDKNLRFKAVEEGTGYNPNDMVWSNELPAHKVIAYFGDNIQDFPKLKQPGMVNQDADGNAFDKFGNGFFILPNPMYGS